MVSLFRVGAATLLLLACTRLASCQEDAPSPRFPWSKQDETRNLSATFGNSSHSYSVQDNWNICMRHEFILPFDEAIDDFAPLMSDLLRILNRLGGGTVRLTKGTYPVGGIIEMPSHTCILGVSSSATTIKLVADAPSFFPVNGMIHSYNGERVTVQSVALDGNHRANQGTTGINPAEITGRDGFLFQKANFVWLLNVVSRDHSGHAYHIQGAKNSKSYHLIVEGSVAESSAQSGFRLQETFYGSLSNVLAFNSSSHGVSVAAGSMHIVVRQLIASDSGLRRGGCGISLESDTKKTESAILSDLNLADSERAGICLDGVFNIGVVRANITSMKAAGSTCYDVRNTHSFSVSDDSSCRVLSRTTYNADNSTKPGVNFTAPAVASEPLALPSPQRASRGCPGGIGDRDVCCPMMCGNCNCRVKLPGDYCCYDQIKQSGVSCAFVGAPCILGM